MLVALFVRHYKVFKNLNFIPISQGAYFTSFIGPNGIGKSSILDALDKVFNGGEWSINIQAKREGGISTDDKTPFIAPVFAIEKKLITGAEEANVAEIISEYLWNLTASSPEQKKFVEFRDSLSKDFPRNSHYLVVLGKKNNDGKAVSLGPFSAQKIFLNPDDAESALQSLYKRVFDIYVFVHVPVETDALEFTKLESREMAKLLDHDIQKEIETAITHQGVQEINRKLEHFLDEVHSHLDGYRYKGTFKDRLTMADLVSKVFEAFFSIKILHKADNTPTPIHTLSSGEKRRAFVDVAYSFLKRRKKRNKSIIVALDEPDASLHVAACHDQFQKLSELSQLTDPASQIITTTHWYGFLPIVSDGTAHSLCFRDEKVAFDSFDLYRYREQIRHRLKGSQGMLPTDIQLKSYNDLTQSIVSSVVRDEPYHWILCEGLSDKIYLEFYLRDEMKSRKLRILPLGGFKEVKKVYEYLSVPLNDQEYEVKGKVLCVVDTDRQFVDFQPPLAKNADFKRIVYNDGAINLLPYGNALKVPTEIEDALSPEPFYKTLSKLINKHYSEDHILQRLLVDNPYLSEKTNAVDCLNLRASDKQILTDFFDKDDNKVRFAHEYLTFAKHEDKPEWIEEVIAFFQPKSSKLKARGKHLSKAA